MNAQAIPQQQDYSYVRRSKEIMQRIMREKNLSADDVKKSMGIKDYRDEQ